MGKDESDVVFWKIEDQLCKNFDNLKELHAVREIWKEVDYNKFLHNPYGYIQELFCEKGSMFSPLPTNRWEFHMLEVLHLKHLERRSKCGATPYIPSLNDRSIDKVKNGQIFTFRCLVQDCCGPEMFPSEITTNDSEAGEPITKSTFLQDIYIDVDITRSPQRTDSISEREILVAITPPGESAWVTDCQTESHSATGHNGEEKRMKMDVDEPAAEFVSLPNYKEMFPELFVNVGDSKPIVCMLKLYGNSSNIKPNDLIEVAGIIELENGDTTEEKCNEAIDEVAGSCYPKAGKIPKLFVYSVVKLADGNPMIPMMENKMFPTFNQEEVRVSESVRLLRDLLSLALGGDRIAAAYAMVAMTAKMYGMSREDPGFGQIGKFALNLSGIEESSDIPDTFIYALKHIVPRTLNLDLTIENVNGWKLVPKKNNDTNQLESGALQMAPGTHVVVNETKLEEGSFASQGAHNITALREFIQNQAVKYDYTYQWPQMPTDSPVIILSQMKSVFPFDVRLDLRTDPKIAEERRSKLEVMLKEKSSQLRTFLTLARTISTKSHEAFADESLNEDFESFFRTRNQTGMYNSKMNATDFSTFITSCRIWSLLNGELSITRSSFMFWKDMEIIRDSRLVKSSV